jgi:hypothetical protein
MVRDSSDINKRVAEMAALGRAGVPDDIDLMIAGGLPASTLRSLEVCFSETNRAI